MNVVSEKKKFIKAKYSYSRIEIFSIWIEQTSKETHEKRKKVNCTDI